MCKLPTQGKGLESSKRQRDCPKQRYRFWKEQLNTSLSELPALGLGDCIFPAQSGLCCSQFMVFLIKGGVKLPPLVSIVECL